MPFFVDSPRRCRRNISPVHQLTLAVVLIAFGTALFLDNIGVLHIQRLYDYWPVILIVFGSIRFIGRPTAVGALWGLFLIGIGSLLLLVNLNILQIHHNGTWPLSLVFIAVGFLALTKVFDRNSMPSREPQTPNITGPPNADILNESVTAGSVERRIESVNFQGGELQNVLGSMEIDLRRAQLPAGSASVTLFLNCVLSSTEIRIPDTWRVSVQAHSVLANLENRTIPPRAENGREPPALIITGNCVLSSVELDN